MTTRMTRVDPQQNMARWYEIDVQPTLFGDFTIERHWGRIGATGQSKAFWFYDEGSADENGAEGHGNQVKAWVR